MYYELVRYRCSKNNQNRFSNNSRLTIEYCHCTANRQNARIDRSISVDTHGFTTEVQRLISNDSFRNIQYEQSVYHGEPHCSGFRAKQQMYLSRFFNIKICFFFFLSKFRLENVRIVAHALLSNERFRIV